MGSPAHTGSIYVIATTPEGTARALAEADQRAARESRVVLLVPVPVRSGPESASLLDEYTAVARRVGVDAAAYACVCHHPKDMLPLFAAGEATIVVGGSRGGGTFPNDEEQLANTLAACGHQVVFAEITAASARAEGPGHARPGEPRPRPST